MTVGLEVIKRGGENAIFASNSIREIIDKAKDQIVEKYADGMVEHVQSDDFKEKLATKKQI